MPSTSNADQCRQGRSCAATGLGSGPSTTAWSGFAWPRIAVCYYQDLPLLAGALGLIFAMIHGEGTCGIAV